MFRNLDTTESGIINCANKNSKANLEIQGRGVVDLKLNDGKMIKLDNVIYFKNLAKNLLSLRKFADQGLQIFLDNKRVNIYDPNTREIILSGNHNKPFWEIEINLNQ